MQLTDYEKSMIDGKYGEPVRLAMNALYDLGEYYDAERFVEIVSCHEANTCHYGEAQVVFAEYLAEIGSTFAVPTTTNACTIDMKRWFLQKHDKDKMQGTRRLEAANIIVGAIPTWSCAPYQAGFQPCFGQHVACSESNVISFVNSVIGARTNRYATPLDLLCAIAGRVPYFGLHVTENRIAQGLVTLGDDIHPDFFEDDTVINLIAYAYGKTIGDRVWALGGMPRNMTTDNLKQFCATIASSGGVALAHIIGNTPEAQTLEMAFNNQPPKETITFGLADLKEAYRQISCTNKSDEINFISLGCPHFSYAEFQKLARLLAGRKISTNLEFWVHTSRSTYGRIADSGLLDTIENSGIKIFSDGCLLEHPAEKWGTTSIMTNSGKFATYCYNKVGIHPTIGNMDECVETAVCGKIKREVKPWTE